MKTNRNIIIAVFVFIMGVIAGYYFGYDHGWERSRSSMDEKQHTTSVQKLNTYSNDRLGYSLQYPKDYYLHEVEQGTNGEFEGITLEKNVYVRNRGGFEQYVLDKGNSISISFFPNKKSWELKPTGETTINGGRYPLYKSGDTQIIYIQRNDGALEISNYPGHLEEQNSKESYQQEASQILSTLKFDER